MRPQATLWLLDLADTDDAALALGLESLGASVQQRYRRFRRVERQKQFLAGRLLLREALSSASAVDAAQITFAERVGAAPHACMPGIAPFFSISHASRWVACAVSMSVPLGLDIELANRQRDFAALAEHSFEAAVALRIAGLPDPERAPAFYRAWCQLEAEYKLGQPARDCQHPLHAELAIAVVSTDEFELQLRQI